MTEQEWLTCADPEPMLEFLRGKASDRKLRLFAVACSRRVWNWIDALGRAAVDVAEKYADGLAGPEELRAARLACQGAGGQAAWYAAATNAAIAAFRNQLEGAIFDYRRCTITATYSYLHLDVAYMAITSTIVANDLRTAKFSFEPA